MSSATVVLEVLEDLVVVRAVVRAVVAQVASVVAEEVVTGKHKNSTDRSQMGEGTCSSAGSLS